MLGSVIRKSEKRAEMAGRKRKELFPTHSFRGEVRYQEPMAMHTSLRIGGPAEVFAVPTEYTSLTDLYMILLRKKIPFLVVGGGTNLLVRDGGVNGVVISVTSFRGIDVSMTDHGCVYMEVEAGTPLQRLVRFAKDKGYTGIEGLVGIPGTFGGAVCGNSGAFGQEIKDVLVSLRIIDTDGTRKDLSPQTLGFGYRHSRISAGQFVLSGEVKLGISTPEEVGAKTQEFHKIKQETQPLWEPSAGCVFKNPEGLSAGKLIDEAGCKGMKVGDVEVNTLHANFFINKGKATSADFIALMEKVSLRVKEKSGVRLEPEIRIVGNEIVNQ